MFNNASFINADISFIPLYNVLAAFMNVTLHSYSEGKLWSEIAQVQILTSSLAKDTIQAYNITPPPLSLNFFTCKIESDNGVLVRIKCIYVIFLEQYLTLTCSKILINISK